MIKGMTHKEWIDSVSKEELAFRLFGKFYCGRSCYQCVHYKRDANGTYLCYSHEHEQDCREEYEHWLEEDMED